MGEQEWLVKLMLARNPGKYSCKGSDYFPGGGFKYVQFTQFLFEMIQFDDFFQMG